jgi:1-phosphofructokinase family hexose kinase
MIVTVTLNPSRDRTLSVPRLLPGTLHRAQVLREDLGGKGINVSRALQALGIPSRVVCILGGMTGQAMRAGLTAAGYEGAFIEAAGETRQNLTLFDEASGVYTKINEPGPIVGPTQLDALRAAVARLVQKGDLWAFCGNLPPGAPVGLYAELIGIVHTAGALAFLDTSGPAFAAGLAAQPYGCKPNSDEAAEWLGRAVVTDADHAAAARGIQAAGPHIVCLTRGADGLLLADGDALVSAAPPPVHAASPVGAGDATLAGLLWGVSDHCGAQETARRAVACGTAAAMQEGTGLGDRALIEQLLRQVKVRT